MACNLKVPRYEGVGVELLTITPKNKLDGTCVKRSFCLTSFYILGSLAGDLGGSHMLTLTWACDCDKPMRIVMPTRLVFDF